MGYVGVASSKVGVAVDLLSINVFFSRYWKLCVLE